MKQIYLIPNRHEMELLLPLAAEYDCAFEFSDFWALEVLDDRRKQEEIIEEYARVRTDFSKDTMHGAFLDVTIHSEDPLIREISRKRVRQSMEIAKRMGLRGVVFHTGLISGFRMEHYLLHWKKENQLFFQEIAEEYPTQQIFMENVFDDRPWELAELAKSMKMVGNFGVCLDYAHSAVSGCPQKTWMEMLAPYVRHMHINDNDLKRDLHKPVGKGKIDWTEFQRLTEQYRIDVSVLIEVDGYEAQKESLEYIHTNGILDK